MLLQKERKPGDRSKPSLSQVRIETFRGSRSHYRDWKRIIEAQSNLYKLEDAELAMRHLSQLPGRAAPNPEST